MKKLNKTKKGIIIGFLLLTSLSFTVFNFNQDKDLIIGTWSNTETPTWKRVFNSDGKCYDYNDGKISATYNYSISEGKSKNGKLTFSFLKLVNINDNSDVYEYEINALGSNSLVLEYLGGMRSKLIYFKK